MARRIEDVRIGGEMRHIKGDSGFSILMPKGITRPSELPDDFPAPSKRQVKELLETVRKAGSSRLNPQRKGRGRKR